MILILKDTFFIPLCKIQNLLLLGLKILIFTPLSIAAFSRQLEGSSPNLAQKCITGGTHYHNFGSRILYEFVGKFLNFVGVPDGFDELFFDTLYWQGFTPQSFEKILLLFHEGSDVAPNKLCWCLTLICRRACTIAFSVDYAKISFDFFEMSDSHTSTSLSQYFIFSLVISVMNLNLIPLRDTPCSLAK